MCLSRPGIKFSPKNTLFIEKVGREIFLCFVCSVSNQNHGKGGARKEGNDFSSTAYCEAAASTLSFGRTRSNRMGDPIVDHSRVVKTLLLAAGAEQ